MDLKLLCLCLLIAPLSPSLAKRHECLSSASNCEECIQSGPECAWCTEPLANTQCETLKGLTTAGCGASNIYYPQGRLQVMRNESITEPSNSAAVLFQPQQLAIHLRVGVSQSFLLALSRPADQVITQLTLGTSPLPAGVNMTFSNIIEGNPTTVQVNVEAAHCPHESDDSNQKQNSTASWPVLITPTGFSSSVKLELTLECQCDCTSNREEDSLSCSGHGAMVCGQCECNEGFFGKQCQISKDPISTSGEDECRQSPTDDLCSGNGKCIEGVCECRKRENPPEMYSGRYCECTNFNCARSGNKLCAAHGLCECDQCICERGWTGEACDCSMDTSACIAQNEYVCNGRGVCMCGVCKCEPPYSGATCEDCPRCPNTCSRHADCVECLAYGTGPKKDRCHHECGYINMTKEDGYPQPSYLSDEPTHVCMMRSYEDGCKFTYTITTLPSGTKVAVKRDKLCYGK